MRISPTCACPPCTARLISGALKSDAAECTVILSLPALALSTSAANCITFSVWKLVAGYGVGMSHLVCAMAAAQDAAATAATSALMGFMGFLLGVWGQANKGGGACQNEIPMKTTLWMGGAAPAPPPRRGPPPPPPQLALAHEKPPAPLTPQRLRPPAHL